MPNWYSEQKRPKSRYSAIINADIFVPSSEDKSEEVDKVYKVLTQISSQEGRINDSNVRLNIGKIQLHG